MRARTYLSSRQHGEDGDAKVQRHVHICMGAYGRVQALRVHRIRIPQQPAGGEGGDGRGARLLLQQT